METLQIYWWLLIAVLGGALVFLLFVQGGQSLLLETRGSVAKNLIVNSLGRKWELTFTTLVVFGGAFFASFPLFYSTSFGGAYWLWMAILFSFVLQAVSYEFRRKKGNLYGTATYDAFLLINGVVGCVLIGVAVGVLFFGGQFTVTRGNILDGNAPVISVWAPSHGLEAITCWKNLLVGFTLFFLARMNAALYMMNSIDDGQKFFNVCRMKAILNGIIFVVLFLGLVAVILTSDGYTVEPDGRVVAVPYKYAINLIEMWWVLGVLVLGVVLVLIGFALTAFKKSYRGGIWWTGMGTILTIVSLLCDLAYNNTCYMPSLTDPQSSLTIANSSSTEFTLTVMSWVSLLVPVVLLYIWYVWGKMNATPLTPKEIEEDSHSY
ncbi:MAG: cytochrome d ubiquinol oxidase subunit II [Muribaculaceae bacterium]|nr:cytochrome d ubiquinol oxidase subunit II [Muribaculaceae bacterium]MDE6194198.1 cytochrome d ubiquinol oxidase subunit II [Muribaculaceae bacterium]